MKIGIDCHNLETHRTGAARYLLNLLKIWARERNITFILYFKNKIPEAIPDSKNFQKKILKTNSNALFVHYSLCRAAAKDKVDILFCPAYIAPVFYGGKIALVLHDIIYEARPDLYNWPSVFDRILLKKVSKIAAKKAKMIFTCSEFSKKEILKYYPSTKLGASKIHAVPLAADEKFIRQPIDVGGLASHIKRKYGIKDKFIFYVGDVLKRRFVAETIEAFVRAANKLPEYQFLIVGKNYTDRRINQNRIIHKNYVDEEDLLLLYNAADLFIWLSSYEGFGLPPLEAMACKTPVLSTKKTSLAEVLGDYPIWVENPKDIDEISEKMLKILSDENLRNKMIRKGLEQTQKFSWQETAEKTLRVLLEN